MTRFTDAALLKGDYAHMAQEFRAGNRAAPAQKDWQKAACDTGAEEAAQEVAKHIFALQQQIDAEKDRIDVLAFSAIGQFRVLGLVPGESEMIRIDGVQPDGSPVAVLTHYEQLSLTFVAVPHEAEDDDDGLKIGFVIFDELKERKKKRAKKKLSLSTSRKMKMKTAPKKKTGQAK
ncbi:hypothetical protein ACFQ14_12955 [Pseudahrensia aquimaris]|uniref:Uncharacterized protein n=1 Tax=Pseudahrensia aquimaris TaxID=744461 RepID=A0ABW3FI60_9HYPH